MDAGEGMNVIRSCFLNHIKEHGMIYFTYEEYKSFWERHKVGMEYSMINRDKSVIIVKIAYYPLPYYQDLRACIEFPIPGGIDFRDVPIKFLKPVP